MIKALVTEGGVEGLTPEEEFEEIVLISSNHSDRELLKHLTSKEAQSKGIKMIHSSSLSSSSLLGAVCNSFKVEEEGIFFSFPSPLFRYSMPLTFLLRRFRKLAFELP